MPSTCGRKERNEIDVGTIGQDERSHQSGFVGGGRFHRDHFSYGLSINERLGVNQPHSVPDGHYQALTQPAAVPWLPAPRRGHYPSPMGTLHALIHDIYHQSGRYLSPFSCSARRLSYCDAMAKIISINFDICGTKHHSARNTRRLSRSRLESTSPPT